MIKLRTTHFTASLCKSQIHIRRVLYKCSCPPFTQPEGYLVIRLTESRHVRNHQVTRSKTFIFQSSGGRKHSASCPTAGLHLNSPLSCFTPQTAPGVSFLPRMWVLTGAKREDEPRLGIHSAHFHRAECAQRSAPCSCLPPSSSQSIARHFLCWISK